MASSDAPPTSLPDAQSLSKRSQKFYDETYKWDSDGFVDDKGVYRRFDCYDPHARAPTPLPPLSLEDENEGQVLCPQTTDGTLAAHESSIDTKTLTFARDPRRSNVFVTVRCSELLRGHVNREHLIGKTEGALIASKTNKTDLALEECYQLCGIPYPDEQAKSASQENSVPPSLSNVAAPASGENNHAPATLSRSLDQELHSPCSSPSSLSDCPSDISEWEVGISVPAHASTAEAKAPQASPQEAEQPQSRPKPQPKRTTRGMTRKAKRGAKKSKS